MWRMTEDVDEARTTKTLDIVDPESDNGKRIRKAVEDDNLENSLNDSEQVRQRAVKEMVEVYYEENENFRHQLKLSGVVELSLRNFKVEFREMIRSIRESLGLIERDQFSPPECLGLVLDDDEVRKVEKQREVDGEGVVTNWGLRLVYNLMCRFLDFGYEGRPIARFWLLETVARMPYFSYLSALHLFSTLGWWRSGEVELKNVHHAEELNEHFHLLIMESLGGDKRWSDRFLAYHISLIYYWILVVSYFFNPGESYGFSQLLECHAVDTYKEFLKENEHRLKKLPPPNVAMDYYENYQYYFDEFRTTPKNGKRRPPLKNLYDVFESILEDEKEHVKTMMACRGAVKVGNVKTNLGADEAPGKFARSRKVGRKVLSAQERRKYWKKWSEELAHADQSHGNDSGTT